jgi:hypothetical protein
MPDQQRHVLEDQPLTRSRHGSSCPNCLCEALPDSYGDRERRLSRPAIFQSPSQTLYREDHTYTQPWCDRSEGRWRFFHTRPRILLIQQVPLLPARCRYPLVCSEFPLSMLCRTQSARAYHVLAAMNGHLSPSHTLVLPAPIWTLFHIVLPAPIWTLFHIVLPAPIRTFLHSTSAITPSSPSGPAYSSSPCSSSP